METPEHELEGVLLRADFRAFYQMEIAFDQPLAVVLGDALRDGLSGLYRMAWCMTASERPRGLTREALLDILPEPGQLGALLYSLIDRAVTPICPTHDAPPSQKPPQRVRWSALQYEGRVLLLQGEPEWQRSTFSVQQALMWEHARHHDPEGKYGRPMAEWEIEEINNRNIAKLMGAPYTDGNQAHRRA